MLNDLGRPLSEVVVASWRLRIGFPLFVHDVVVSVYSVTVIILTTLLCVLVVENGSVVVAKTICQYEIEGSLHVLVDVARVVCTVIVIV